MPSGTASDQLQGDQLSGPLGEVIGPAEESVSSKLAGQPPRSRQYGVVVGLLAMLIFFSVTRGTFLTWANIISILTASATLTIMACGLTLPLVAGDFDLSIAAAADLSGMVTAALLVNDGVSLGPAIAIALVVGVVIGVLNGFMVAFVRVNAFVATLAAMSVLDGVALGLTGGQYVGLLPQSLTDIGQNKAAGLPIVVWIAIAVAGILWWVLRFTQFGRYLYATGSSERAAAIAGVNTRRIRLLALVASALLASLAGVLIVANAGSAYPSGADGLLLPAYAAAFVGASVLSDGRFHIGGTVIGVILLQAGSNGLALSNVPLWLTDVFDGAVLALAVGLTRVSFGGVFSRLAHRVRGR